VVGPFLERCGSGGTGAVSRWESGAVPDSEGALHREEARFGEFQGGDVGGRPPHF